MGLSDMLKVEVPGSLYRFQMNYARIDEVRKHWPEHEVNVRFQGYCIEILVCRLGHGPNMLSYVWTSGECETLDEAVDKSLPTDEEKAE